MPAILTSYRDFESQFARDIVRQKYSPELDENWGQISYRVVTEVMKAVKADDVLIDAMIDMVAQKRFLPGGRYLYSAGRDFHQVNNCLLLRAEDSREGWSDLLHKSSMALMTGAGIGIVYSDVRPKGSIISRTGGFATGPISLMKMVNECGRGIMQGGARRSAIWAGLHWNHQDIFEFLHLKDWTKDVRRLKAKDYNFPATMDGTNISIILDDEFFEAYHNATHERHELAQRVYWEAVRSMLKTGEPGFSIDCGENEGEHLRNACCEITSSDDSDVCNLGSIVLPNCSSKEEFMGTVDLAQGFLLAGGIYSDIPYLKVGEVRNKNRRTGLGIMGFHEQLLKWGQRYGDTSILSEYMDLYRDVSNTAASHWAAKFGINEPVGKRAIAPNGTISIAAETTGGCEPILSAAQKRRHLIGDKWAYQYIIDPAAKRLIDAGVDPDTIEDAFTIEPERRIDFQVFLQQYVDHGVSSTINLPAWGSEKNNEGTVQAFGDMLITKLPRLRGLTTYPDGARGGQPLNPISVRYAMQHLGKTIFEGGEPEAVVEGSDICSLTGGGSCGS